AAVPSRDNNNAFLGLLPSGDTTDVRRLCPTSWTWLTIDSRPRFFLQFFDQLLKILALVKRVEVGVCVHFTRIAIAGGGGLAEGRHGLVGVLGPLGDFLRSEPFLFIANHRRAQGQGAGQIIISDRRIVGSEWLQDWK